MKSRWDGYRQNAVALRKKGESIRDIELSLGIPRSTLSGWFKNIVLTSSQNKRLASKNRAGLAKARIQATESHRKNKQRRLESVRATVEKTLQSIPINDLVTLEIALAMLYFGEGSKTKQGLRLGNSDPRIIRFYIDSLKKLYALPGDCLYFALHLRADQNEEEEKAFWSQALDVPLAKFRYCIKDPRTAGKPTRLDYHGVCLAQGGPVEIQRRLMYLSEAFCERATRG